MGCFVSDDDDDVWAARFVYFVGCIQVITLGNVECSERRNDREFE